MSASGMLSPAQIFTFSLLADDLASKGVPSEDDAAVDQEILSDTSLLGRNS